MKNSQKNKITFIDLCCGLGGIRIGFEQACQQLGYDSQCVFYADIKLTALKAYQRNFHDDIFDVTKCDIKKTDPTNIPDFDFLLAGFPCQPFSNAGKRLGFEDTRGTLFFHIANIIKEKKPTGFLLENVEGLVTHQKGKTLETILNVLNDLEYHVEFKILNACDFGVAQHRNRIYIIGRNDRKPKPLSDFHESHSCIRDIIDESVPAVETEFTQKLLKTFSITDLYGKAIKDKRGGKNNIHSWDIALKGSVSKNEKQFLDILLKERRKKHWAEKIGIDWMDGMPLTEKMIRTFYDVPDLHEMLLFLTEKGYLKYEHPKKRIKNENGNTVRVRDTTLEKGYNIVSGKLSFEFSFILNPDGIAPTLVATDMERIGVPVHNGIRKLTVKEGLKLFGFPEWYTLDFIKEREAFDLLGNSVCVPVIKEVSLKLLEDNS